MASEGTALSSETHTYQVFNTKEDMLKVARTTAQKIASHSPLVVQGTKRVLNFAVLLSLSHSLSRCLYFLNFLQDEHPNLDDSLEHVALWNSAFLFSDDLGTPVANKRDVFVPKNQYHAEEAVASFLERRPPKFRNKL